MKLKKKNFSGDPYSKADVCLLLEGTYPYVLGGVSSWTHELIREQNHLDFHIVALLPPDAKVIRKYDVPDNVVSITNVYLQDIAKKKGISHYDREELFGDLKKPVSLLYSDESDSDTLAKVIDILSHYKGKIGSETLLNSEEAWNMLLEIYKENMPQSPFIDFFWSFRALLAGIYSLLLTPIPEADVYHALCTGYAGLMLSRAKIETGKPCLVTEHGIYTNERRIEISSATWIFDQKTINLSIVENNESSGELRDLWIGTFAAYSRMCYESSDRIVTLYKGNQTFQLMDGADPEKLLVIPNGVDVAKFSAVQRQDNHTPVIALIGRVVPIKDVKTFIRACEILRDSAPGIKAYIMGPEDEDMEYFEECKTAVDHAGLQETVIFTGKVNIVEYMKNIDVMVLTSISEAQPLVILELGAAGIPSVATDVGSCRELIMGTDDEAPQLGVGGAITPLANPKATAAEVLKLLADSDYYKNCSDNIKNRVMKYYHKKDQHSSYRKLYQDLKNDADISEKVA